MATVKDITTMCKAGQIIEAYNLAKADLDADTSSVWAQREVGWALYYMIKDDADTGNYQLLQKHLDELMSLDQLTVTNDSMIFDNVLFKMGGYIKNHMTPTAFDSSAKLSTVFTKIKHLQFNPSKGYSFLLQSVLKFENWPDLADFFDWWNLDNLSSDDYTPYVNQRGQKLMTLAERAFIANSKVLLRLNDLGRIEEFLPKLDMLMEKHPEMLYPGYFYGKLLLSLGSGTEEELRVIIPFARKKATEFWVWQLLSEVFQGDADKQLACLLRAVNCKTQESFLGKVRTKLAQHYISRNLLDCARYHIDCITKCYLAQGWSMPHEMDEWLHQGWINAVVPKEKAPIDYMAITNDILCEGTEESIAIVAYVDDKARKVALIYGPQKRASVKLRFKVKVGEILRINYIMGNDNHVRVLNACRASLPNSLSYAKFAEGIIDKRDDKEFAFIKLGKERCFVSPACVNKFGLKNGETVKALVAFDYNKSKETWNWVCISIKR